MRSAGLALIHVGLMLVLVGSAGGLASARPSITPPAAAGPIQSAVVFVAGPSVHQRFAAMAGLAADAARPGEPGDATSDNPAPAAAPARRPGTAAETLARARTLDAALDAAEAEVLRRQAPVVAAAERLGIDVISQYQTVASALLVHATAGQLAALAREPDVVAIEPAPLVRPALARSVPRIRADRLVSELGYDGGGAVVAVIDSGIDYTHAQLGGPGNPAAYTATRAAAERIDDTWEGAPLFPTAKVIGGWDFVGPRYNHPNYCTDELVRAGRCVNTPEPDPDPLDEYGHGTHVAGIIAGQAAGDLPNGVAPGAKLVALKIYGTPPGQSPDESIDVLVDAIEWCADVNLGREVDGIAPPRVDVINMSLGEPFAQGSRLMDQAVAAAVDSGIVVVASAGNEGDRPFVTGAPGASPKVLSTASSIVSGDGRDLISDFSARGPGKNGALKPNLTAPGSGIVSAGMGTGTGARTLNGTSMASPHVAGAAALLHSRNRAETLGLGAADLGALLMNYALPQVVAGGGPAGVPRQGAGRIDVFASGTARLVVRAGDIASVNVGPVALTDGGLGAGDAVAPPAREETLTLRNLTDAVIHVLPAARFIHPDDEDKGVVVELPDEPIAVPARGTAAVPVTFRFEPEKLRDWTPVRELSAVDAATLEAREIDGHITLAPVAANGTPLPDIPAPSVPFYVLPRRASAVHNTAAIPPAPGGQGKLRFENPGFEGELELFMLPEGPAGRDPDEPEVGHELDLEAVGVRLLNIPDGAQELVFGFSRYETAPIPQATSLEIYLDLDLDGRIDQRVRTGPASYIRGGKDDRMLLMAGPWDDTAGTLAGPETQVRELPSDLFSTVLRVPVPRAAIGMSVDQRAPFDFYVIHRGITEDWWDAMAVDVLPDGANQPQRTWYRVDPTAWGWRPRVVLSGIQAGGTYEIALEPARGSDPIRLLALYPTNASAPAKHGMAEIIDPWAARVPAAIYMPFAWRGR